MTRLSIATYNLGGGDERCADLVADVIGALDADIVGLTEADDPVVVAELAEALGYEHVWAPGSGDHHVAVLHRLPLVHWRMHNTRPLTQGVLETHFETSDGRIAVFTAHLLPYLLLPWEIQRWRAVGALLRHIRAEIDDPHLIMGDLNSIAAGDRVRHRDNPKRMRRLMALQANVVIRLALPRLTRAGYTDCFRLMHPAEPGYTFMPRSPTTRYDYVLACPDMTARLRSCDVVTKPAAVFDASDHLPLAAQFDRAHMRTDAVGDTDR